MWTTLIAILALGCPYEHLVTGLLFPQDTESRETKCLDGMWSFRTSGNDQTMGFREKWFMQTLEKSGDVLAMPVPSSYNDVYVNKTLRDYVGWVWYSKQFYVPHRWQAMLNTTQFILRFGSVHYNSEVWVNGKSVVSHEGGHLPFEADISKLLEFSAPNLVTVAVNNTLSHYTIPPGEVNHHSPPSYPQGYHVQKVFFDFFNYAGIHRPVWLYTRPKVYIQDISVLTSNLNTNSATIKCSVVASESRNTNSCQLDILDRDGKVVASSKSCTSDLHISGVVHPWWPVGMSDEVAYLYTLKVQLRSAAGAVDVYRLQFGVRTVEVVGDQFLINAKPFYFMGFGRHEDSNLRGKGLDLPLITRDFSLIHWVGANSFRTSHYPYAEEIMDACDQQGIVVVDECPGVGLRFFNNRTLTLHKHMMSELIGRDKNRPSVVMWSIANEPQSYQPSSQDYFKAVFEHTKALDPSRPATAVLSAQHSADRIGQFADVTCVNRYFGWYEDTGHTETIYPHLTLDLAAFHTKYKKPVILTEYGADTVAGLHREPSFIFTEEYQLDLMRENHKAFDELRKSFLVGEMIWNFADFMTDQEVNRVVGNKKGIFTRERQPKMSAHFLRARYHKISNKSLENSIFADNNSC